MSTIASLHRKFQRLNTDELIEDAFKEVAPELTEQNRQQMTAGQTKAGGKIGPSYRSNKYARVKNSFNPLPGLGTPDLRFSGSFYRGLRTDVSNGIVRIESSDTKSAALESKYLLIFGLGGSFKRSFLQNNLGPAVRQKITNFIGLKFN